MGNTKNVRELSSGVWEYSFATESEARAAWARHHAKGGYTLSMIAYDAVRRVYAFDVIGD